MLAGFALRMLLAALGIGLRVACRMSPRFRAQLAHERTVQIGSADGVWHHYHFTPRRVASHARRIDGPDVGLCFAHAGLGVATLLSPRAVGRIVRALLDGEAQYEGNAVLVLWFFGLTRFLLPVGRTAPLRSPLPDAYLAPDREARVAARVVREPAVAALDPAWAAAHRQHARMVMPRGSAGEGVKLW